MSRKTVRRQLLLMISLWVSFSLGIMQNASAVSDPTRPAYLKPKKVIKSRPKAKPQIPLKLNTIVISKQRKVAIINNKIVKIGDHIHNAKVMSISRNYVVVSRGKKQITLSLGKLSSIKRLVRKSDLGENDESP